MSHGADVVVGFLVVIKALGGKGIGDSSRALFFVEVVVFDVSGGLMCFKEVVVLLAAIACVGTECGGSNAVGLDIVF